MALSSFQLWPGPVDFDATNPADYVLEAGTNPDRLGLAFAADATEVVAFPFVMPKAYAGGTLTLVLNCKANATTGDVDADAAVEAITPDVGELGNADSYDTVNVSDNNSVPATAHHLFSISITLTNKDSIAVGDQSRIKLSRDGTPDTLAVDWEVYGADLRES